MRSTVVGDLYSRLEARLRVLDMDWVLVWPSQIQDADRECWNADDYFNILGHSLHDTPWIRTAVSGTDTTYSSKMIILSVMDKNKIMDWKSPCNIPTRDSSSQRPDLSRTFLVNAWLNTTFRSSCDASGVWISPAAWADPYKRRQHYIINDGDVDASLDDTRKIKYRFRLFNEIVQI